MPTIQYPKNPNTDTAFVVQDDGTKNRALMTAPQDTSTLELPKNANSCKGYVTVDGKKQRVILTADIGGGGGGGGSVDYAKTVQRAETMPTADSSNAGQQFLYSGESDATYTHGYIYENVATTTSSSASAAQTVGSTLSDIAVDIDTLEAFTGWTTDNSLQIFYTADGWSVDTTSLGVTYTGTPNVGDAITITYTAESTTYAWTRIDVQPAPSGLPDQTGQNGKFLTTDGTDASWSDKPLVNTATGADSLQVLGNTINPVTQSQSTVVGKGSYVSGNQATVCGTNSFAAPYGVAIGRDAGVNTGCNYGIAIGRGCRSNAASAIQLGAGQTNSDANTFKVANANGNFEIMSADGTIPAARHASLPAADGTYVLKLVIASGVPTLSWVAE